jgi:NAD(P)-dependent dehydrogenase (short-subunit alcohol dehydrogenase family)
MRTWLITGSSSGFGLELVKAAAARGDHVIATMRNPAGFVVPEGLAGAITPVAMDVTDEAQVRRVVAEVVRTHGRIDVLVNNAGYGLIGSLEECTSEQIRRNIETNLMGPVHTMRAVLPVMRQQKSGHIINMSAAAAIENYAGFSVYGGAKYGLEGVSEAVAAEVKPFGVRVTLVQPGPFRTDFIARSMDRAAGQVAEYQPTVGKFAAFLEGVNGKQPGDPAKAAALIVSLVDEERPPFRLALGKYAIGKVKRKQASVLRELEQWEGRGAATEF